MGIRIMKPLIELASVCKVYDLEDGKKFEALKNITLSLYEGETLGLLGVNGAGKTTLSAILATLHPLTSGQILFEGQSIYEDLIRYRTVVGYCPQRPNVSPYLTLRQSLSFAGEFYGMSYSVIEARIDKLIHDFELTRYADQTIKALSGGYRQRFMLARTLMHKPRLVILDEPTVALDAPVRRYLWEVIRELKRNGVTIVLTTHYLEEAEQLADRVCLLNKGGIVLVDSPENLKKRFSANDLESVFITLLEEAAHV
jgi:ABC-2 type transport system ATP-binding protein